LERSASVFDGLRGQADTAARADDHQPALQRPAALVGPAGLARGASRAGREQDGREGHGAPGTIPAYRREFRAVFGRDFDPDGVAQAIATYVRTIRSGDSPYDRFQAGDQRAMSESAQRGLRLFEGKAMCTRCHAGFNFTGEGYRNIGAGMTRPNPDLGRYTVTKDDADRGAFKTPTLRDVAKRGPYMHDGSEKTLADVVEFYDRGGVKNPWLSSDMKPLGLTAQEQADLVEFMKALTGRIDSEVSRPPDLPK
jgi:cytochrome c peroxidase